VGGEQFDLPLDVAHDADARADEFKGAWDERT